MMRGPSARALLAALLALALFATACHPCHADGECAAGEVCVQGACIEGHRDPPAQGHLTLSPAAGAVAGGAGEPVPSLSFTVGNDGAAALGYRVACTLGTPSAPSGTLPAGASAALTLALPAFPSAGERTATCTVSTADGTGGPLAFTATLQIGPDATAPAVALTGPAGGSQVHGTVTLQAEASDAVGVATVDFAVDGRVVATATAPPWSAAWASTATPNGAHALTAIARDAAGNAGTSTAAPLTVRNGAGISVHATLGLPDGAVADPAAPDRFLSVKPQYALSYDAARKVPNWVSWELNATWLGAVPRQNDFRADSTLPPTLPQALLGDYAGSGWDRGHLCPSEDRTATVADNQSTFFLTNMVPQSDNLNGGPWAQLESYARGLAASGKELFVVAGGVFGAPQRTIGAGQVAVPSSMFKLVVVLDAPGQGVAALTPGTRVIAVVMPNDDTLVSKSADWRPYRVRPRVIEAQTGLDLFADAPPAVKAALAEQLDAAP